MTCWKDSIRSSRGARRIFSVGSVAKINSLAIVFATVLLCYQDVEAESGSAPECMAHVLEVVDGRVRLESEDGSEKRRLKGTSLNTPLCVVRVERKKLLVRMNEDQDNWWIKRRFVLRSDLGSNVDVDVDCGTVVAYSIPGTPGSIGSSRGSGEDPCR